MLSCLAMQPSPAANQPDLERLKIEAEVGKLKQEIDNLKTQRRNDRFRLWLDCIKAGALALAAVTTFAVLQRPESLLNRTSSRETIARERAKLLLDSLKDPDSSKRLDALRIIRAAYGSDGASWLDQMEQMLKQKVETDTTLSRIYQLKELTQRREELRKQWELEVSGRGLSGRYGEGSVAKSIQAQLGAVDDEITKLTALISQVAK
jgi:hypothetical protein